MMECLPNRSGSIRRFTFKNYIRLLVLSVILSTAFIQQALAQSPIGYATVEQAFQALESDPSAKVTEYEGWIIFNQKGNGSYILWSFTPDQHSAHPAAIRREIVKKGDEIFINMNALCESGKFECDQLINQFKLINEGIKQNMSDSWKPDTQLKGNYESRRTKIDSGAAEAAI